MKTVITLLTLLIGMTIGSISYSESTIINAAEGTILDEHVKTAPIPAPVSVPVISTEENEEVFAFYSDDGC